MSDTSTQTPPNPPSPPATPPPPSNPPSPPAAVQRPDGVSDAEWAALGDPGKTALVRERARATTAEQALAAARAKPPATPPPPPPQPKPGELPDFGALIRDAVAQAIAPIQERDAQREADEAAGRIRDSVTAAAAERFHDPTDALAVDLASLTDGAGLPDPAKITTALDDLLKRKPHLGRAVDDRRRPAPNAGVGSTGPASAPLDDRVKASLARMQSGSGVKFAEG